VRLIYRLYTNPDQRTTTRLGDIRGDTAMSKSVNHNRKHDMEISVYGFGLSPDPWLATVYKKA